MSSQDPKEGFKSTPARDKVLSEEGQFFAKDHKKIAGYRGKISRAGVQSGKLSLYSPTLPMARPPWTQQGRKLESLIRKALHEYQMLEGVDKLAIALSGGKDSLTLLFMLKAILGYGFPNCELYAIYVDGAFSCGPALHEQLLKPLCQELQVPFFICSASQTENTLECYSCSRTRRQLIFAQARELGISTVAFGHHRDDNAQTLLLNLLHKAEFAGMLPKLEMVDFGVTLIRPLIHVPEAWTRAFAEHWGFSRVTCNCPRGQHSMRKQVAESLIHLETLFPQARANVARAGLVYGSHKARRTK